MSSASKISDLLSPAGQHSAIEAAQSIYVHVPFCEQKCGYCDFFTITDPERKHPLSNDWLSVCAEEALLWIKQGALSRSAPVQTVFFGGGTPSLLHPGKISDFLIFVADELGLAPDAEITLETQPGTADEQGIAAFAKAGINRFSVGVQTFDANLLAQTGRRHTVEDARATLRAAAATGRVVSLDLIASLPGQTFENWKRELEEALAFHPHHLSVYELTFHPGTSYTRDLKRGALEEAEEEQRIAIFEHTRQFLTEAGYEHYEISNYARPGFRSRHNQNYWQLGNFVGLGAGAHSSIFPHRYANANSAEAYARSIRAGVLFGKQADATDPDIFAIENLQMALRQTDGFDVKAFHRRMGSQVLATRIPRICELEQEGLLCVTADHIKLTSAGQLRLDSILEYLL